MTLRLAVSVTEAFSVEGLGEAVKVVVVDAWFTTCESVGEVLARKLASPPYVAARECDPTVKDETVRMACPFASGTMFTAFVPSLKVIEPVGVPLPPDGATVAVSKTGCPNTDGFAEDAIVAAVPCCPMPLPFKGIMAGRIFEPLAMLRPPVLVPVAEGLNVMFAVHVTLTGRGEEEVQSSVSEKSPVVPRLMIRRGPLPLFVSVSCCELDVPTF